MNLLNELNRSILCEPLTTIFLTDRQGGIKINMFFHSFSQVIHILIQLFKEYNLQCTNKILSEGTVMKKDHIFHLLPAKYL